MQEYCFVPTLLRARFRMMENEHAPRAYRGHAPGGPSPVLRDELLASSRLPGEILRFLAEMDRKIDLVLNHLERESLSGMFPHEGRVLGLSAEKLVLETDKPLEPGAHVDLLLVLEELPLRTAFALARVEEFTAQSSAPACASYGLHFVALEEEDRESIIRHVFQEDRRRIRRLKNET